jgi:hypothetical protein
LTSGELKAARDRRRRGPTNQTDPNRPPQ